jgi:hypothetical protein
MTQRSHRIIKDFVRIIDKHPELVDPEAPLVRGALTAVIYEITLE